MRTDGIAFHQPAAFWLGCLLLTASVAVHAPMFMMAAPMHFHMAGMPMDAAMLTGMAMIPLGLALAAFGLLPRLSQVRSSLSGRSDDLHFILPMACR